MNAQLTSPPHDDQNFDLTKVSPQIKAQILAELLERLVGQEAEASKSFTCHRGSGS